MSRRTWVRLSLLALCAVLVLATLPAQAVQAARPREGNACSGRSGRVQQRRLVATGRLPGTTTYVHGTHNSQRATHHSQLVVPTYARVSYRGIYRGIDLVYHGTQGRLEYDWLLHPGASVRRIRLAISGVTRLRLAHDGALLLVTSAGTLRQARPVAYQTVHGHRHAVSVYYVLLGHGRVGLRLGRYDHRHALVIDPVLSYGSYLGGAGTDQATAVALDQRGDLFLTGYTTSADFITTTNAYSTSQASGNYDVFITEISPTGAVSYSTYLGGSSFDYGEGIAVDPQGNAYVTGLTNSSDFPTTVSSYSVQTGLTATQTLGVSVPATGTDAFVVKLSPDGSHLVYAMRLGSLGGVNALGDTWGWAIAVAPEGSGSSSYDAYVTGQTDSPDFPVTTLSPVGTTRGVPQAPHGTCTPSVSQGTGLTNTTELGSGPCYDAFVVRLTADGSGFVYSTYLGGGQDDMGYGIAVSGTTGIAVVTGRTASADFPVSGTLQSFDNAPMSGTLQQLNSLLGGLGLSGISLNTSTISGTAPQCNETNCPDAFVVALSTTAPGLPVGVAQPLWELSGAVLGQLQAVSTTLSTLGLGQPGALLGPPSELWGTYLGGSNADEGRGIAVDPRGNVYVTGATSSADFTTTTGAYTTTFTNSTCPNGLPCSDAFVAKLPPDGSRPVYSSRFGGSGADTGNAIAVDTSGHAYLTGQTSSADFPLLGSLEGFSGTHAISSTASYTTSMAFVVRLNKQGSGRFYSSDIGGSGGDTGNAIAVDGIGDVMLAGGTGSTDFLTLKPQQPQNKGGQDAFVSGIDATTRHLTYAYDGLNRLARVSETLGNTYAYSYDIAGNRTDEWLNGVDLQHAQYDQASELITLTTPQSTTIQSYDAAGNLIGDASNSYSYDALDRLTTLTPLTSSVQTSYTYNGDGVLVAQATGSQTPTLYTQDLATSQGGLNPPPPPPPPAYPAAALPLQPPAAPAQSSFAGAPSGVAAQGGFASAAGPFAGSSSAASSVLGASGGMAAGNGSVSGEPGGSSFAGQGQSGGGFASPSLTGQFAGGPSGASFVSQGQVVGSSIGAFFGGQAAGAQSGFAAPSAQTFSASGQGTGVFGQPGTTGPSPLVASQNQALLSGGQYVPVQVTGTSQGSAAPAALQLALSSQTLATPESAGGPSQVLQTTQGSVSTDYLYGLDRLASLSGSSHSWYITDLQGSVRYTQNDSGGSAGTLNYDPQPLRYDPYGAIDRGADGDGVLPTTFGYRGELQDPNTGLIDLRARMYNPATGQFLTRDPLVQQTDQPYAYAGDDPQNNADPTGQAYNLFGCAGDVYQQTAEAAAVYIILASSNLGTHAGCNVAIPGNAQAGTETVVSDAQGGELWVVRSLAQLLATPSAYVQAQGQAAQDVAALRQAKTRPLLFVEQGQGPFGISFLFGCKLVQEATTLSALRPGTDFNGARGPQAVEVGRGADAPPVSLNVGQFLRPTGGQVPGVLFYQPYTPLSARSCLTSNFSFKGVLHCGYQFLVGDDIDTLRSNAGFFAKLVAVVDLGSNALVLVPFVGEDARLGVKAVAAGVLRTALHRSVDDAALKTADELGVSVTREDLSTLEHSGEGTETRDRSLDQSPGCGCFVAGTWVATPTGHVAIQTLHKGDRVLAENPTTGKVEAETVLRLIVDGVKPLLSVTLSDGTVLKVTADHPFWVDSGGRLPHAGWLHAEHLQPGDRLRTAKGKDVVVVRVRHNVGRAVVYTLTVAHDHTFFVGAARVLVHNANFPCVSDTEISTAVDDVHTTLGQAADFKSGQCSLCVTRLAAEIETQYPQLRGLLVKVHVEGTFPVARDPATRQILTGIPLNSRVTTLAQAPGNAWRYHEALLLPPGTTAGTELRVADSMLYIPGDPSLKGVYQSYDEWLQSFVDTSRQPIAKIIKTTSSP